jgi:hypothetical protein
MNSRLPVEEISITSLETHFRRFISPSNMFLVPKILGGLGELTQFTDEIIDEQPVHAQA